MRYQEFKNPRLNAYQVIVVLNDHASAPTIIYADTPENAWMIAAKQFGSENIVNVNSPNIPHSPKPMDKASEIQFWADRFRQFTRLAGPKPKRAEFADQVDDYLERAEARSLAKVKAKKAQQQLNNLTR